jgi:hypothetical protein
MQLEMYRGDRPAAPAASGDAAARVYASPRGAGSSGLLSSSANEHGRVLLYGFFSFVN